MDLAGYTELFLAEAREHLATVNRLLLHLEQEPDDVAAVDELFRAVHTLKGTSAAMEYRGVSRMAHALEHTLEGVRAGRAPVDPELVDTLLAAADALERELERQAAGGAAAEELARPLRVLVTIGRDAVFPAVRALLLLRAARGLGEVSGVEPPEDRIVAGECGLELNLTLKTAHDDSAVIAALSAVGEVERVEVGPADAGRGGGAGEGAGTMVRVAQARLDTLADHAGELIFARDRLLRAAGAEPGSELEEALGEMSALVGRVRDEVMRLRRVPASETLDRLPRVVRDAARGLGKEVQLELVGREVQLDRSVLREAGDLLVHLLRNAVDHGIEEAGEREAAGKPIVGRITLTAELDRAAAVLRVEDDGRGLPREAIRAAAVERGLISDVEAGSLSDRDALGLITLPGFSTAARVTDVSGRGVGLDVVRSRVEALGGTLELRSERGVGTEFTLRLPLTLSIQRVFHLSVGGESYLLTIAAVEEVGEVGGDGGGWRERVPLVSLAELLGCEGADPPVPTPMVVVEAGGQRFGLLVDGLRGQAEVAVKRFDAPLGTVPVFAGAALLADGRPALVLDAERLAAHVEPQGAVPIPGSGTPF
jgi:two-component system chemotaxis sensor kinase CheA